VRLWTSSRDDGTFSIPVYKVGCTAGRHAKVGQAEMGNLSFFLGGKAASDGLKWAPDLQAVRAAIKFAMDTRRL
jgi:hypothetical protein